MKTIYNDGTPNKVKFATPKRTSKAKTLKERVREFENFLDEYNTEAAREMGRIDLTKQELWDFITEVGKEEYAEGAKNQAILDADTIEEARKEAHTQGQEEERKRIIKEIEGMQGRYNYYDGDRDCQDGFDEAIDELLELLRTKTKK